MTTQSVPQLYYTTREAATLLRRTPQHVRDLIAAGKLEGERHGGRNLVIPAASLRRLTGQDALPGHEDVSSAPDAERRELLQRARRLIAELGVVMAELSE